MNTALESKYSDTAQEACKAIMGLQARFNNYCRILREVKVLLKQHDCISDALRSAISDERAAIRGDIDTMPDNYWQYGFKGDILSVRKAVMLAGLSEHLPFLDG